MWRIALDPPDDAIATLAELLSTEEHRVWTRQKVYLKAASTPQECVAPSSSHLDEHPQVHFHFTPTYSSWLNQVELWFSKIARDLIHWGIFTSETDLDRKIMNYIREYNEVARPVKWRHDDLAKRIQTALSQRSTVTVH